MDPNPNNNYSKYHKEKRLKAEYHSHVIHSACPKLCLNFEFAAIFETKYIAALLSCLTHKIPISIQNLSRTVIRRKVLLKFDGTRFIQMVPNACYHGSTIARSKQVAHHYVETKEQGPSVNETCCGGHYYSNNVSLPSLWGVSFTQNPSPADFSL